MSVKSFLRFSIILLLALPLAGCATANAPTPPLAPGYNSATDQTLGQSLAALNAFVKNESTVNYPALPAALQAVEKPYLNALITATNLANATYVAYHAGTGTLISAQGAFTNAQNAQTSLTSQMGVH